MGEEYELVIGPDDVLSTPCEPCGDENVNHIANALMDYAIKHKRTCAGLAANQLGFSKRVCVIKNGAMFISLIDPVITKRAGEMMSHEGCLSWPGRTFTVKRSTMVSVKAKGQRTLKLRGLAAIAAQHEIDHLDGKEV